MSEGTATSAPRVHARRGAGRPQASRWTPVPPSSGETEPDAGWPASAGLLSFHDVLASGAPARAPIPGEPTPTPEATPDEPASDEPALAPGHALSARVRRLLAVSPRFVRRLLAVFRSFARRLAAARPLLDRLPAVPRLLDRRLALVAVSVVALSAGVGSGAVAGRLTAGSDVAPTTPEQCLAAQAAWTASASSQVGMTAEDPDTLRDGFLGASAALDGVAVPSGVADDWLLVATFLHAVAAAVESVDPADGEAVTAAVGAAVAERDTDAVTEASARVTAYLKAGCVG